MLDTSDLLKKLKIAKKCESMCGSDLREAHFHKGYARALREILEEISPLTLVQFDKYDNSSLEEDLLHLTPRKDMIEIDSQVAIIRTPKNSIAACSYIIGAFGELDNCPYSGYAIFKDANNDAWIVYEGETFLFDEELLEIKEEN